MGGKPLTAMNVVCFPSGTMDIGILKEILRGGLDKLREAETILVGGHSVEDKEIKYGLSVTGVVHPKKVITNRGIQLGDLLVLTKPLGTGIINTAIKGEVASKMAIDKIVNIMSTLNKNASLAMQEVGVNACTDITGFGLLGHAVEMVRGTNLGIVIHGLKVPFLPEAQEYAQMGLIPGGTYRNRDFFSRWIEFLPPVPPFVLDILFDPQTSGGLLISVCREKVDRLLQKLKEDYGDGVAIIGEVVALPKEKIIVD